MNKYKLSFVIFSLSILFLTLYPYITLAQVNIEETYNIKENSFKIYHFSIGGSDSKGNKTYYIYSWFSPNGTIEIYYINNEGYNQFLQNNNTSDISNDNMLRTPLSMNGGDVGSRTFSLSNLNNTIYVIILNNAPQTIEISVIFKITEDLRSNIPGYNSLLLIILIPLTIAYIIIKTYKKRNS